MMAPYKWQKDFLIEKTRKLKKTKKERIKSISMLNNRSKMIC